jgi:hypothetical protein
MSARDYLIDALQKPQRIPLKNFPEVLEVVAYLYKLITEDRVFEPLALTITKDQIIIFDSRKPYQP